MNLEASLAALLQTEVDKRVAAIQAAADMAVEQFRQLALRIASGEAVGHSKEPGTYPSGSLVASAVAPPQSTTEAGLVFTAPPPTLDDLPLETRRLIEREERQAQIDAANAAAYVGVTGLGGGHVIQ